MTTSIQWMQDQNIQTFTIYTQDVIQYYSMQNEEVTTGFFGMFLDGNVLIQLYDVLIWEPPSTVDY